VAGAIAAIAAERRIAEISGSRVREQIDSARGAKALDPVTSK